MIVAPVLLGLAMFALHAAPVLAAHRRPRAADDARQLHRPAHAAGQEAAASRSRRSRRRSRSSRTASRARRSSSASGGTPRRPPSRPSTSRRCGWVRCCGPAGPSTGTSSALRLGVGRARSRNTHPGVDGPARHRPLRPAGRQAPRRATRTIDDVPFVELLPSSGAIGIAGPRHLAADVVRGLGVQLFGLHAPNEIVTAAIVDPAWTSELEWMKWLPHTTQPALARSPTSRSPTASPPAPRCSTRSRRRSSSACRAPPTRRGPLRGVRHVDGARHASRRGERLAGQDRRATSRSCSSSSNDAPVDRPRLTQVIERGADAGIYTIFLAPTVESLPAACRTFIDATRGPRSTPPSATCARGSALESRRRRGRLSRVRRDVREAARAGRRLELGHGRLAATCPSERVAPAPHRHRPGRRSPRPPSSAGGRTTRSSTAAAAPARG